MTESSNVQKANKKGVKKVEKKIPKRLKKYRVDGGFTIYSLADRLGVNYSSVSYWENGVKHPRHDKIIELEDIFGASYRELFSDMSEEEIEALEERMNHKPE